MQAEGAGRVARIAAEMGVERLVQISAIGADPRSDSDYARTKAAGEAAVLAAFPAAVILRPSIIFGHEDQFFNRFAAMTRMGPILPVVGAETRFQPVYVDDVAQAAVKGVTGTAAPGIYELGGPDVETFRELMQQDAGRDPAAARGGQHALLRGADHGLSGLMRLQALTLGLIQNGMITRDQVRNLRARQCRVAGRAGPRRRSASSPLAMDAVLPEYLWRYRPSGQYAAIKDSAKNLRRLLIGKGAALADSSTLVAALLGLLEGLTEFIPVSSTGHLLLAGHFLGFESAGRTFEVVIQLGAVLAILTVYAAMAVVGRSRGPA